MSAGSAASNLGYGRFVPNANINGNFVNVDGSNYAGGFSSNEVPSSSLAAAKCNYDAAAGFIPGQKGGGLFNLKKVYKKMTKRCKTHRRRGCGCMSKRFRFIKSRRSLKKLTKSIGKRIGKTLRKTRSRFGKRLFRGGYSQYQNNMPMTGVEKVAGIHLNANQSALANPPPFTALGGSANCLDNYNHYSNSSFPSRGWGAV
jgi:hypothetical protein